MPIDGVDSQNYQQYIDPTTGTEETQATGTQQIDESQYSSSVSQADAEKEAADISASNPTLVPPDPNAITGTGSGLGLDPSTLTKEDITKFLAAYPQFTEFLNSQNIISEEDIQNFVVNTLLENPNSIYSAEALSGTALAKQIYNILQVTHNPQLQELWENLRADILVQNNPMAQVLIESAKQDLIAKGVDPEAAEQQAKSETLHELDVELSDNGVVTPFYGTHPEMSKAISTVLAEKLAGSNVSSDFISQLETLVGTKDGLMAAMDAMAAVSSGQSTDDIVKAHQGQLDEAQNVINTAIPMIQTLPLPDSDKAGLLAFMKAISEAISSLKALMAEINVTDSERAGKEFSAKMDQIQAALRTSLNKLKEMMDKIRKMERKMKKMSGLMKFFDIGGLVAMIAATIAAIAVAVVLAVVILLVLAPLAVIACAACPLLIPLVMLAAPLILVAMLGLFAPVFAVTATSIGLKESGKLDDMMDGFFGFAMGVAEAVGLKDLSEDAISYIGMGILGVGVLLPILVLALLPVLMVLAAPLLLIMVATAIVLAPLVAVLLLVTWPLVLASSVLFLAILAVPFIVAVLAIMALPLVMAAAFAFIPDLLARSGAYGDIASGIGSQVGMDEDQIEDFEYYLRGLGGTMSMVVGAQVSDSVSQLSSEDQDVVDQRTRTEGSIASDHSTLGRTSGMGSYLTPPPTLIQKAAQTATSEEAMEKAKEEMATMMKLLRKIIAQLEKVMQAIQGGGDPAALNAALASMKTLVDGQLADVTGEHPEAFNMDLQPYVDGFFENVERVIPNILPSPDAIKDMLRQLQEQQAVGEDDKELIRTNDIMG